MENPDDNYEIPESDKTLQFHEMELDDRLLKAIAKLGWVEPTPIQEQAIPRILEGKDVLMRARTGTGKTGAFAVPLIQKILVEKQFSEEKGVKALILAPSKELADQIYTNIKQLTCKCSREITCVDISPPVDISHQKHLLTDIPDIVVSTPSQTLLHTKAKYLNLKDTLKLLVIDEADLMFSFGYEDNVKEVLGTLPKFYQSILASATLSEDVITLKKMTLHNAVILKLEEPDIAPLTTLTHYYIQAEEDEKAVTLYTLLKLSLIRGKSIVFVKTVDRCYKLKLFLEQFGIASCILNSELPALSRCHAVKQFNSDLYDIIIASDEKSMETDATTDAKKSSLDASREKSGKRKKDKESGVARGIDFQRVSNVLNFDFPLDVFSYIHRAGRTARGRNKGTVLSFVNMRENELFEEVNEYLKRGLAVEEVFNKYKFTMDEAEGFRYRARDAWRAVTRIAVREARLKEIKREILTSKKLKRYFDENPRDLLSLRHDKALHTVKLQDHLTNVPDYIIPRSLRNVVDNPKAPTGSPVNNNKKSKAPPKFKPGRTKAMSKYLAKKKNPLLSMEFNGFEDTDK